MAPNVQKHALLPYLSFSSSFHKQLNMTIRGYRGFSAKKLSHYPMNHCPVFFPGSRQQVRGEVRSPGILGLRLHLGLLRRRQPAHVRVQSRRLCLRERQRPRLQGHLHRGEEERHPRRKGRLLRQRVGPRLRELDPRPPRPDGGGIHVTALLAIPVILLNLFKMKVSFLLSHNRFTTSATTRTWSPPSGSKLL